MLTKLNISKIAPFRESVDFRRLSIRCWICSHLSLIQVLQTQDTTTELSGQFDRIRYINNISHFSQFLPTPLSILRKAKDASESSKNVFLLRFSRIKHFRDTILLKFFLLTISPKLANFELGEYFHSPKSTVDAKYINSSFFVEIHALTAQLSLFQSNFWLSK